MIGAGIENGDAARAALTQGHPGIVWRRLIADTETPVGAALKLIEPGRGDFLLESHFQPPMSMASLMPGWFADHSQRMKNFGRVHSAGILFPADRRGQIVDGKLKFRLDVDDDLPMLRRAMATLTKVHFAAGALECYPALAKGQKVTPDMDIDAFFRAAIREQDDVTLSSSHPHGGNAINEDPQYGVVDPECRVHGTTNVFVTDASVFPSCIRVNAQWTTMAMAHYFWHEGVRNVCLAAYGWTKEVERIYQRAPGSERIQIFRDKEELRALCEDKDIVVADPLLARVIEKKRIVPFPWGLFSGRMMLTEESGALGIRMEKLLKYCLAAMDRYRKEKKT